MLPRICIFGRLAARAVALATIVGVYSAATGSAQQTFQSIALTNSASAIGDGVGHSVAFVGSTYIAVGAPFDDNGAFADSGSVAIYERDLIGTGITFKRIIPNPTPASFDQFGYSVSALGTNTIIIGTPAADTGGTNAGRVYVFDVNGTQLLSITNPLGRDFRPNSRFGHAVARVGVTNFVVGAPFTSNVLYGTNVGQAFLYDSTGRLLGDVTHPDPSGGDQFGTSVAPLGTGRFIVGAPGNSAVSTSAGAAYLFNVQQRLHLATFLPSSGARAVNGRFGTSVAGFGTNVLIGAPLYANEEGRSFLFDTNGLLYATIAGVGSAGQHFGVHVAGIGTNRFLIGAPRYGSNVTTATTGGAYLYFLDSPNAVTSPIMGAFTNDYFGQSVAGEDSGAFLVGAPGIAAGLGTNGPGRAVFYRIPEYTLCDVIPLPAQPDTNYVFFSVNPNGAGVFTNGVFYPTAAGRFTCVWTYTNRNNSAAQPLMVSSDVVIKPYPIQNYYIGDYIPAPACADTNDERMGDSSSMSSTNRAYWHRHAHRLYAVAPGTNRIFWKRADLPPEFAVRFPVDVFTVGWPTNRPLQVYVSNSPPVNLATGIVKRASVLYREESSHAEILGGLNQFTDLGSGRSLVMLSTDPSPDAGPILFQFVKTITYNDPSYFRDTETWPIGREILDPTLHDVNCGSPHLFEYIAGHPWRYLPSYYNRASRTGSIIPVNRSRSGTRNDDLLVVYYQMATNVVNPLDGSRMAVPICWPYQPVRYQCVWPGTNDATLRQIVIANEKGGDLQGLNNPGLYVQNDYSQPGYNPNDEHALFFNGRSREPELLLDSTNVVVVEGGVLASEFSLSGPPEADVVLRLSSLRTDFTNLIASFSATGIVTEITINSTNWNARRSIFYSVIPDPDPAEAVDGVAAYALNASEGIFDNKLIFAREADTNRLALLVESRALTVPEGSSRPFGVRLTQPPQGNILVNISRESGDTDLTAENTNLTFTAANWNVPQTVTIQAAADTDAGDGSATFRVVASGGLVAIERVIVTERDSAQPAQAVFALRDDLGDRPGTLNPPASEPYVLVMHNSPQPAVQVFRVVAEESPSFFTYSNNIAGRLIQPPYPLSQFSGWVDRTYGVRGPFWQDRKKSFWARAAGDNGGTTNIVMRFYYPRDIRADFFFPPGTDTAVGNRIVPWLDRRTNAPTGAPGTPGIPTDITYVIRWPDFVPELRVGESLIKAKFGLPNIKGQVSANVIYEQTAAQGFGNGSSVKLIDATHTYQAPLLTLPSDIGGKTVTNLLDGTVFFTPLPPNLRSRLWWHPTDHALRFKGEFISEFGTEEPVGYLLLNVLTSSNLVEIRKLSATSEFQTAVNNLAEQAANVRLVSSNTIQRVDDTFALTAGLAKRPGYVTLAFNNVVNDQASLPADRGAPVSLEIIRVNCPLYRGETKVTYPADPFDETVAMRHSGDFAGKEDQYVFRWEYHQGPGKPAPNSTSWLNLTAVTGEVGRASVVIKDAGSRSLGDWWYRCQWRTTDTSNPCGTNWTTLTDPVLVEGWVKRVLGRINFYGQFDTNLIESAVDVVANTISKAGTRWIGAVPFNVAGLTNFGLIEIYETVLKRGIELSIEGIPPLDDEGANRALLLVAEQLANIYMLLGNEAYADAADPTIGFVSPIGEFQVPATSTHCFMDQAEIDSLLKEELVLLRGLDDSLGRDVRHHPIYNRLPPNMGVGFQAEAAYVLNYGISEKDGKVGTTAEDALKIYPQGHGDAWGHYLSAIQNFYRLLRSDKFTWTVTNEFVKLAGVGDVPVNFLHERKFAQVAAAKARTGAEIVNLTYRSRYVENPDGQWQGYLDSNLDRAWGLSEWASRAGQGAFIDWVVGNALLPPDTSDDTNEIKVARTTVAELREIIGGFTSIQDELDKADAGLNPLGLAKNVIPFDIDPARIDAGETHFEQIYARAIKAMNNAIGVFNQANSSTQNIRKQADTLEEFQRNVSDREFDFNNRLIEVFGYPYPDDPAYAGNQNVPDLYHYMINDRSDITGELEPTGIPFTVNFTELNVVANGNLTTQNVRQVTYLLAPNGLGAMKDPTWTRPRRALGEIQMAHSDLLQTVARFKRALNEYENLLNQIEDQESLLHAQFGLNTNEVVVLNQGVQTNQTLNSFIRRSRDIQLGLRTGAQLATTLGIALAEFFPKTLGLANDLTSPARATLHLVGALATQGLNLGADIEALSELDHQQAKESAQSLQNISLTTLRQEQGILQQIAQIEQLVRQEVLVRLEIYNQREALHQSASRYNSTLAKGQRVLEERLRFRQQTASRVQDFRYRDMAFRVFRNEALQQYRAQFDLAAMYVYLATAAFDYETAYPTNSQRAAAQSFFTDIVRARSIGVIDSGGNPLPGPGPGKKGDGGLAAALFRVKNTWDTYIKGPLGFSIPDRQKLTFSLRNAHFRVLTNDVGDTSWRNWLTAQAVPNLWDLPEFRRYCKPPAGFGTNEPGFVIPFSSSVVFAHNFFTWPEVGGGGNFNPSYYATKIRSASIKFIGYDSTFGGLDPAPRVYLVPVGNDVLRSPIGPTVPGEDTPTREWKILDQFVQAPLSITDPASTFFSAASASWIPISEMELRDNESHYFAAIRRYGLMQAFHDGPGGQPVIEAADGSKRLIGRSVWNTRWLLIIPAGALLNDRQAAIQKFINGRFNDGEGVTDILLTIDAYSFPGN